MGKTFYDLTDEELCELMCGGIEDGEELSEEYNEVNRRSETNSSSREGVSI